jgi:hypothetical protein
MKPENQRTHYRLPLGRPVCGVRPSAKILSTHELDRTTCDRCRQRLARVR